VFIHYSNDLQQFHGKAIAQDIDDRYVTFPSLFITHEMRVCAFHPFAPVSPDVLHDKPWQDWISLDGMYDDASGSFIRDSPPGNGKGDINHSN
jgi:hypothetical protein